MVVVGDKGTGKTSLITSFVLETVYPHTTTVCESYYKEVKVRRNSDPDAKPQNQLKHKYPSVFSMFSQVQSVGLVSMCIWDMSGATEHRQLRGLVYRDCNVVIICTDVSHPESVRRLEQWKFEVATCCPGVPIIVAATKADLCYTKQEVETCASGNSAGGQGGNVSTMLNRKHPIDPRTELKGLAGVQAYVECNTVTRGGVEEVFAMAVWAALVPQDTSTNCYCQIL